jgi:hypothetical protein
MRDERDDGIDAALKALREVAPPDGMEGRIAGGLQERAAESRGESTAARGWWSGVACGAAVATLAIGVVIFAQHRWESRTETRQAVARVAGTQNAGVLSTAYAKRDATESGRDVPCASPPLQRTHILAVSSGVAAPTAGELRAETSAPSKPAPELPLTAQERELVRLARTVDPKQLVALDDTTQAKMEAEDAAEFERFFTPPPAPPLPATEENE